MYPFGEKDFSECVNVLREFGVSLVWIFGGAMASGEPAGDLDIACEGIPDGVFYNAAGRLLSAMNRPVDLVDVSKDTRLSRYIRSTGKLIYDSSRPA